MSSFNISDITLSGAYVNAVAAAHESDRRKAGHGIVTLTKIGPKLLLGHEAKPLKTSIPTIGESPRLRCECH
jgi:hypothetical protein